MTHLTARQSEVVATIRRLTKQHGYPPTMRELGDALGITSPNGILCHLNALRAKGELTWTNGKSRTLRLTPTTP
jgi:repressor LexA